MKNFFSRSLVIFLVFFSATSFVSADTFDVHLSFDRRNEKIDFSNGQNSVARNLQKQMSIVNFHEQSSNGIFEILFLDSTGAIIEQKQFSPQEGDFILSTPYYSTATKLIIQKANSTNPLLSADLTSLLSCNNNKVCEFELGENSETCLPDCGASSITLSQKTQQILQENNGVIRDPKTSAILLRSPTTMQANTNNSTPLVSQKNSTPLWIIVVVSLIVFAGFVWIAVWVYRKLF
jgi:hypothetical protein